MLVPRPPPQVRRIDEEALSHGYLRLRHFMAQIVDACEQCEALEASSRLPPPSLRFLRALLGAAVYHLTMLEIEVESRLVFPLQAAPPRFPHGQAFNDDI